MMKKFMALTLAVVLMLSVTACALLSKDEAAGGYDVTSATAVLESVWNNYPEDQKFPVMGGDYDTMTDGVPGVFDYTNAEYMDGLLAVPADAAAMVDDAGSLIHAMMANNFTAGAFHVADASNIDSFISAVESNLASRQWLCGQPEKYVIVSDGAGYVVAMFGLADVVDGFAAELVNMGGTIVVDQSIA